MQTIIAYVNLFYEIKILSLLYQPADILAVMCCVYLRVVPQPKFSLLSVTHLKCRSQMILNAFFPRIELNYGSLRRTKSQQHSQHLFVIYVRIQTEKIQTSDVQPFD